MAEGQSYRVSEYCLYVCLEKFCLGKSGMIKFSEYNDIRGNSYLVNLARLLKIRKAEKLKNVEDTTLLE